MDPIDLGEAVIDGFIASHQSYPNRGLSFHFRRSVKKFCGPEIRKRSFLPVKETSLWHEKF